MFRYLTKCCILYTEMIHTQAVLHNASVLRYSKIEHPVVCQLGGNDPDKLAQSSKICEDLGYDEINLNVGCPSERVQDGCFGAVLMKDPEKVAEISKKIRENVYEPIININCKIKKKVSIPVTVKCRIGVDEFDSYEFT